MPTGKTYLLADEEVEALKKGRRVRRSSVIPPPIPRQVQQPTGTYFVAASPFGGTRWRTSLPEG